MVRWWPLWLLLTGVAWADWPLVIIELQHRLAEDLVPLLAPLAGADGGVSGNGGTLFVRASPARLAELRAALARLDVPSRTLLVEVRGIGAARGARQGVAVGIDEPVGDQGWIGLGPPGAGSGLRLGSDRRTADGAILYQVRVLDGGTAFIGIGGLRPVEQQETLIGPGGTWTRRRSGLVETGSGFYVRPRSHGEQVVVDLAGRAGDLDDRAGLVTTQVSGRLGEWLPVGAVAGSLERRAEGLGHEFAVRTAGTLGLELRVVPLR